MDVKVTCDECQRSFTVMHIEQSDWNRFVEGELVQNVWPDRSENDREALIGARTHYFICPVCWDQAFRADPPYDEEGRLW